MFVMLIIKRTLILFKLLEAPLKTIILHRV